MAWLAKECGVDDASMAMSVIIFCADLLYGGGAMVL